MNTRVDLRWRPVTYKCTVESSQKKNKWRLKWTEVNISNI